MVPEPRENTIHRRIRERLFALGLTPDGASRKAGLDKTYLRKMFERPGSSPKSDTLQALAVALGTTTEWLMTPQEGDPATEKPPSPASDVRLADVRLPPAREMPSDVPVLGTAAGSHASGAFQFEGGVIEYVRRPPAMMGVRNLYALYIEGTSMEPEHRPGDLRFIHPDRPPRLGDSVIVEVQYEEQERLEATIGHLVKKTGTALTIGKLNPPATVEIKLQYVKNVHKVLTLNDLFGV